MKRAAFVYLFFMFAGITALFSQNDVNVIGSDFQVLTLEKQYVYSEKEIAKKIQSVLTNDDLFEFQEKKLVNQGIHHKHHWIKTKIKNESNLTHFIFEFNQSNIDSLLLYAVQGDQIIEVFPQKGLHFAENNKPTFLSNKYAYIYDITIPKGTTYTFYMRASVNDDAFRVMNKVWSIEHYKTREESIKIRSAYFLIFFGFVVLICFISIAMFTFTRQRLYLYYMGFVAVIFLNLMCLRHFISPLIVENFLFLGNNFVEMFGYLQLFFVLLYTNHFFDLDEKYPRTYRIFKYTALLTAILFVAALFLRKYEWFYTFSYIFSKFVLITVSMGLYFFAIFLAFKRQVMAYYYVIAYFPLFLFVGHFILTAMRLTNSFNPLEWEYVIFIEIIVLTIAMAHRYYLIMKENSDYQLALIEEQERGIHGMIEAQESERSRIAKDLHDGVVQQIGSVILKSRLTFENLKLINSPEAQHILKKLESSNQELRTISHQMMPRTLKELGIIAALEDMLDDSLPPAGIHYRFEHFNLTARLSDKIEINLYRIAQELVNNIIKHSGAKSVNIQLFKSENSLIFIVEDDGKGIPKGTKINGMGLLNIQNRIEMVDGQVNFGESPQSGALITIKIPIEYGH